MEKYGINQASLANRLGKNQSTISNKIRILSLPEDIQIMLVNHKLTERHARALLKVDDDNASGKRTGGFGSTNKN